MYGGLSDGARVASRKEKEALRFEWLHREPGVRQERRAEMEIKLPGLLSGKEGRGGSLTLMRLA